MTHVYWVSAERKKGEYPSATSRSGKWLIFVDANKVDRVWAKIRKAVEEGKLGDRAKVATAKANPLASSPARRVICIYTYDYGDEIDVKRIRQELRRLGISDKIPYKADEDTLAGRYPIRGHKEISKYYE